MNKSLSVSMKFQLIVIINSTIFSSNCDELQPIRWRKRDTSLITFTAKLVHNNVTLTIVNLVATYF